MLVPSALNYTKKIRKSGADMFANVGLEKPGKKQNESKFSPDVFSNFSMELKENAQNPGTNGWASYVDVCVPCPVQYLRWDLFSPALVLDWWCSPS